MGDEASQPFSHVKQAKLCPQVHQTVAGGCAGQTDDPLHQRSHLHQALESFGLMGFEGGQFIDDNHVIVKG
ncbi:hypothetical protein SDC9_179819 [bioreactor metagenome]|uniref:Uncharacterized protein n=1 Tax=bioreactor metagenome TaxID=1076179 RepID=A0A645GZV9_9ZZZZ